jgi:hypothetical protein
MSIRQFRPITAGTRFRSISGFDEITRGTPEKSLLEPLTYMNLSGRSVRPALKAVGLGPDALLVVHDEIDLPLAADWPQRPRQIVDHVRGKPSLTRYHVLQRDAQGHTTRLLLQPLTGRSHQLRVHLQAIGHPIVGDALYAPPEMAAHHDRLMLHATRLEFRHPLTGDELRLLSAAPF